MKLFQRRFLVEQHRQRAKTPLHESVSRVVLERAEITLAIRNKEDAERIHRILNTTLEHLKRERNAPPTYQHRYSSPTCSISITGHLEDALTFLNDCEIIDSRTSVRLKEELESHTKPFSPV